MEKSRPGTMIYFDILEELEEYTDEEVGQLFRAILRYGTTGEVPEFSDRGMRGIWRKMQFKADRDAEAYEEKVANSRYAVYCRDAKKQGKKPLSRKEWDNVCLQGLTVDTESQRAITGDNGRSSSLTNAIQLATINSTINNQPATVNNQQSTSNCQQSSGSYIPFPDVQTATVTGGAQRPPTLEEVIEYAESRGRVDLAEKFFDYYDAGDWHDKNGAKIWSWKQTFLAWAQREPKPPEQPKSDRDRPWHIETRDDGREVIVYDD